MHRKPDPKAAAHLLAQAFAAQGIDLKHQAALNLLATLEGFESYAHMKASHAATTAPAATSSQEFVVSILFTEEDVGNLRDARDDGDEDGIQEMLSQAKTFRFKTQAELDAFKEGVEEAKGSLEYEDVTDEIAAV